MSDNRNGQADCPACGCNDVVKLRQTTAWGLVASTRYICGFCGNRFTAREPWPVEKLIMPGSSNGRHAAADPTGISAEGARAASAETPLPAAGGAVIYSPVRCPECGSKETKVVSSPRKLIEGRRIRHHQCKQCDLRFKSVEEP